MNKEALKEWALALWGGEYPQGHGGLCTMKNEKLCYCCLGVATELFYKQLGLTKQEFNLNNDDICYKYHVSGTEDGQGGYMPKTIGDFLGLEVTGRSNYWGYDPVLEDPVTGYRYQASYWNDCFRKSFKDIALMINHTFDLGLDLTDKD